MSVANAVQRARSMAVVFAVVALVAGLMSTFGWILDEPLLKTGFTGKVSMKANAAVCVCCVAVASWCLIPVERSAFRTNVGRGLGAFVAVFGAATLSQHVFDWDLGIDQLLFSEPYGAAATVSPGRMGPPASTSFMLLGAGLYAFERRTRSQQSISQWLAAAVLPIALLGILGYATSAEQLYGIARYTGVSLPMAISLLLLATAIFLARCEDEPASIFVADHPGGALARTLIPTAIVLPILTGWLRTVGERWGFYDHAFGRALMLLGLIVVFTAIVWRLARRLADVNAQRTAAEHASERAQAEARRLADENVETSSVLESLLAHAPLGLLFFDGTRRCVRANDFAARTPGSVDGPRLGATLEEVLPGAPETLPGALERAFSAGASTMNIEVDAAGERSWLAGVFPVKSASGETALAGVMLVEITDRKRLEAQKATLLESERAARMEAERSAALKDDFLATLSHELRTPLNAILGWATIARQSPDRPPSLDKPLEVIERNARVQAQLIEDLLDVSRIVSGKLRLVLEPVHVLGVVQAAVSATGPAAAAKQIEVSVTSEGDLVPVRGDAGRLQQVAWNLLSNAVKFTPKGGKVRVLVRRCEDAIEIRVSDDGVGISADFLPHVFDRFRQADASTTRRHGGLGLGLAIAKQLVEMHGGSVSAQSGGEGQGATFCVSLPTSSFAAGEPVSSAQVKVARIDLSGVHVLVIDDESDAREFVGRILSDGNASVALAGSVDEGLAALERNLAHVVITDIGMPGKDGYDFIRAMRQEERCKSIPAIAMTAFARAEDRTLALNAGFTLHMAKPIDPDALTAAVANLARR